MQSKFIKGVCKSILEILDDNETTFVMYCLSIDEKCKKYLLVVDKYKTGEEYLPLIKDMEYEIIAEKETKFNIYTYRLSDITMNLVKLVDNLDDIDDTELSVDIDYTDSLSDMRLIKDAKLIHRLFVWD